MELQYSQGETINNAVFRCSIMTSWSPIAALRYAGGQAEMLEQPSILAFSRLAKPIAHTGYGAREWWFRREARDGAAHTTGYLAPLLSRDDPNGFGGTDLRIVTESSGLMVAQFITSARIPFCDMFFGGGQRLIH